MSLLARDTKVISPLGEGVLLLETFRGYEKLGKPYRYSLTLLSKDPAVDVNAILGQSVTVRLTLDSGVDRYFHGIVSYFAKTGLAARHTRYEAVLSSRLEIFEHTRDCRVLFDGDVPTHVASVLADRGFTDVESGALQGTYRNREFTVQYRESDLNFVQRLLEEEGIYYFFKHDKDKHTLIMADSASAHASVAGYESVLYLPKQLKHARLEEHFWSLRQAEALYPGKYSVLRGYDYTKLRPGHAQIEKAYSLVPWPGDGYDAYDYPGGLYEISDASSEAVVRRETDESAHTTIEVEGNTMGLGAGNLVSLRRPLSLEAQYDPFWREGDFEKTYLITSARYEFSINQYETGDVAESDEPYRAVYVLMDSQSQFRPARQTIKPRIQGPQTAIVVGPAGEEIHTDSLGRIKVQFDWDRVGKRDDKSCIWLRVAQMWAGKQWGALHIPRIGQEVMVSFLDGDPDRPVATMSVYNADNMPPYALPDNKTQSGTKSRSSKGGAPNNFNELRFEDLKGKEEVHLQAEKDLNILVKNDESRTVKHDRVKHVVHDELTHVDGNRREEVGKDETIKIHGNRMEIVDKDETITVKGNRTQSVTKDENTSISGERREKIEKDETITISGKRTESVAKDEKLKVEGARKVAVDKADSLHVGGDRKQSVGGGDSLTVGSKIELDVQDEIVVKSGQASITLKKDGTITLDGKDFTVVGSGVINLAASTTFVAKGSKVALEQNAGGGGGGGGGAAKKAASSSSSDAAASAGGSDAGDSSAGGSGGGSSSAAGTEPPVRRWPVLAVHEVRFDSIPVVQDGATQIDNDFPRRWTKGKPSQSPICYASESHLTLGVVFDVTTTSTDDEDVQVKGVMTIDKTTITWKGTVKVKAGAKTAKLTSVRSAAALPAGVAIHESMSIAWSMIQADGATWSAIGKTQQTLYVTLKAPAGVKAYWTLLDLSCRAAAGKITEDEFVPAAFAPFRASVGDGKGLQRKGDGVRLSYYLNGVDTPADQSEPSVYTARGILSRPDGTGRCGGWANLLIHLFKLHGVTGAKKLWFVRDDASSPDMLKRFLVKNCTFVGDGTSRDDPGYPYKGKVECIKQDGLPGQGKTNPQFDFGDHVVVEYGGKIYDPSYGSGPTVGQRAYEDAGIAGVGAITDGINFNQGGTPQFISEICGKGYIHHRLASGETLAKVAANFGAPSADALFNHKYNKDLKFMRVTPDQVVAGDFVRIPREMTTKPILASTYV